MKNLCLAFALFWSGYIYASAFSSPWPPVGGPGDPFLPKDKADQAKTYLSRYMELQDSFKASLQRSVFSETDTIKLLCFNYGWETWSDAYRASLALELSGQYRSQAIPASLDKYKNLVIDENELLLLFLPQADSFSDALESSLEKFFVYHGHESRIDLFRPYFSRFEQRQMACENDELIDEISSKVTFEDTIYISTPNFGLGFAGSTNLKLEDAVRRILSNY
ncbi:hypothetical protein [Pseudobacteriovorax antillogorgiicola]|uniref:Uncharacterized protein n=1 Tax=Pseudobacteriovorax antillogorgiicola TaxID=1513793 RepID=A0A1Y6BD03_9BACT|nr:hypothetical protein [Pseudobacteriovorax antillogorgiicola]TCS58495.1 hypothetical protein EDD56_1028 [Pseudobacteriovorax antillogorgiicola]SME98241.1 hypothetical protein SAMN06296036_102435 [Pseudobacteriovorax antillogorgiicola]